MRSAMPRPPARIFVEAVDRWEASRAAHYAAYRPVVYGQLALWEGDPKSAVPLYEEGARMLRDSDQVAFEINALSGLSEAYLAAGRADAALAASGRATSIHRAHDLAEIQGIDMTELWWHHHLALHGQRQHRGRAARAGPRLPVPGRTDQQAHRRGPAPQLPQQGRRAPQRSCEATLAGRRRSARSGRRAGAPGGQRRACRSPSSGSSTRACA